MSCDVLIVSRSMRIRWASASDSGSVAGRSQASKLLRGFMESMLRRFTCPAVTPPDTSAEQRPTSIPAGVATRRRTATCSSLASLCL